MLLDLSVLPSVAYGGQDRREKVNNEGFLHGVIAEDRLLNKEWAV